MKQSAETERSLEAPGIQSIEVGIGILRALADVGGPVNLTHLARLSSMDPSKARRYLVSFLRSGLVEQDARGHYMFGPLGVRIGLAALSTIDPVRLSGRTLIELRDVTGETAILSVWGNTAPTVMALEESVRPVMLVARLGATLPLLTSATGQVFAAFLDRPAVKTLIAREWEALDPVRQQATLGGQPSLDALLDDIRERRFASVRDQVQAGIHSIAGPVFSHKGNIVAAVTLITRNNEHDEREVQQFITEVTQRTAALSRELGFAG